MSQPETQTQTSGADGGGDEYALARAHAEGVRALGYEFLTHEISLAILQRYLPAAVAALAAPAAKGGTEVPAGWKLVPVAPTEEMVAAGTEGRKNVDSILARPNTLGTYEAMLAASPAPAAGATASGSGDLAALSAGALPSNAADRLLAVQHPKYPSLHVVGWEFSDAEEGIRLVREALAAPTPDLGAQGEPVAKPETNIDLVAREVFIATYIRNSPDHPDHEGIQEKAELAWDSDLSDYADEYDTAYAIANAIIALLQAPRPGETGDER